MKIKVASFLIFSAMSVMANAQSFIIKDKFYEAKDYYNTCNDKCPEITYRFIDTQTPWLDNIINKAVISNIKVNDDDNKADNQRWQAFDKIANPSKVQMVNQLNYGIDNFVKANQAWHKQSESESNYSISSLPSYLGHKALKNGNELELFSVDGDQYLGGAHGVSWSNNYVFDIANKKQLNLDDVILPNQRAKLTQLVHQHFINYLKQNDIDAKEHEKTWKFFLTKNFTFDNQGLVFHYQPYELTPFVMGQPEITVPYKELNGVIKADYLD